MSAAAMQRPTAAAEFVESARLRFESAAAAGGVRERFVRVGESRVRLRFAGDCLVPLVMPALAHLETRPAPKGDLTICLFDSESSRTPMLRPPWSASQFTPHGEVEGFNDSRVKVAFWAGSGLLQCLDRDRDLAVQWTPSFRLIPWWERSIPLRPILNWWFSDQPFQPAHAAAVGSERGGALIVGPSGSGKSTTALACLGSGLRVAGDDYVVLRTSPPHVFGLYSTAKLEADNLCRFPGLARLVSNPARLDSEKAMLFLHDHRPRDLIDGFPLLAVLVPEVTGGPGTRIEPISRAAALAALAQTTCRQLPGARLQTTRKLLQIVGSVPCYRLLAGTDLGQIPVSIGALLDSL